MKKILVTGSSGYIGTHLCARIEGEYEVHRLDIVPFQKELQYSYQDTYFPFDITKPFTNSEVVYDAVVHLAALISVGESQERPISYYITNLNGTMNVLNKIKTKNFIFASTGAAQYCESAYAISKRAAEDVVRSYCQMAKIDYTTFRFYNVIGSSVVLPKNPDGLMMKLIEAAKSGTFTIYGDKYQTPDGTGLRDYVHVDEICDAIRAAIEKPANQIECLGHGVGHTVKEMTEIFQRVNNVKFDVKIGPERPGDVASSVLKDVSPYMQTLFTMDQLLTIPGLVPQQ